jgi:hypothetical protein
MTSGMNVAFEGTCRQAPLRACANNGDCNEGECCKSENGCETDGVCTAIPTDLICTAVVLPYCGCDGVTRHGAWGCILDRFAYQGECR